MPRGSDILTGGTRDVSPQFMTIVAAQSGADATTTTTTPIPIQRMPTGMKAQVMEVLKVFYWLPTPAATTDNISITAFTSTSSFGTTATSWGEPRVFAGASVFKDAVTSGIAFQPQIQEFDTTDGSGHGVLVATDNIYTQVQSVSTGVTNTVYVKLLYRWKNVTVQEYIGIVQSQQ